MGLERYFFPALRRLLATRRALLEARPAIPKDIALPGAGGVAPDMLLNRASEASAKAVADAFGGTIRKLPTPDTAKYLGILERTEPPYEGRVPGFNLSALPPDDMLRRGMKALSEYVADEIEKAAPRRTWTQEHRQALNAIRSGTITPEIVAQFEQDKTLTAPLLRAVELLAAGSVKRLTDVARGFKAGTITVQELREAQAAAAMLVTKFSIPRSNAAAALQALQQPLPEDLAGQVKSFSEIMGLLAQEEPAQQADMLLSLERAEQRRGYLRALGRIGTGVRTAWIEGLLSSPATHLANMASNTGTLGLLIGERGLAGMVPAAGGVPHGEATAMLFGLQAGLRDALSAFNTARRTGVSAFGGTAKFADPTTAASDVGITGPLGTAVDYLGHYLSRWRPTRFLLAEDEFAKTVAARSQLWALAYRQVAREGAATSVEDFGGRVAELIRNPSDAMLAESQSFARMATFTQDLGPVGSPVLGMLNAIPLGRLFVPFVSTPTNIAKFTWERLPVVAPLKLMKQAYMGELADPAMRDLALGKMAMVGLLTLGLAPLAAGVNVGDYRIAITGNGPLNPESRKWLERNIGWRRNSIAVSHTKTGETTYYGLNRIDPFGTFIGFVADLIQLDSAAGEDPEALAKLQEYTWLVGLSFSRALASKTFLKGATDFFDAVSKPEEMGLAAARGLISSIVPAGVSAAAHTIDPVQPQIQRGLDGAFDQVKNRMQGIGWGVYPELDMDGKPIVTWKTPALVSALDVSRQTDDPTRLQLADLKVTIPPLPWAIGGTPDPNIPLVEQRASGGVMLTPEQRHRWAELTATVSGASGETWPAARARLMNKPIWKELAASQDLYAREYAGSLVKDTYRDFRDAAQDQLLQEYPELNEQYRNLLRARDLAAFKAETGR